MKKIIVIFLAALGMEMYSQEITVNVWVLGLDRYQPMKKIVSSQLSTQEELDAVTRTIEKDLMNDTNKWGPTPLLAVFDNIWEDVNASDIPEDSVNVIIPYTDGSNTSYDKKLFKSLELRQSENPIFIENFVKAKLKTPVNGKYLRIFPVFAQGSNHESDIPFLKSISSEQRVYMFDDENDLNQIREKLFDIIKHSPLVLNIVIDYSGSMQKIGNFIARNVITTIQDIYKTNKDSIGLKLKDFILIQGGPAHVGTEPRIRADEIFFTFELSKYRVMKKAVSQKLYNRYAAATGRENPSKILGEDLPQTNLSYYEVLEFISWLNSQWKGRGTLRLISEYEWENLRRLEPAVFSKEEFALRELTLNFYSDYDVSEKTNPKGNPTGTHVVVRGISYEDNDPVMDRPEYRGRIRVNEASPLTGFRLVLCE